MDAAARYTTPEAAVMKAIDEAGGPKHVGVTLRPEYETAPDTASRWVHHCCEDSNRSKFGLRQLVWIFRAACRAGLHTGFIAFARLCGYRAEPLDVIAQVAAANAAAEEGARLSRQAMEELALLTPELLARAEKIGLKVVAA